MDISPGKRTRRLYVTACLAVFIAFATVIALQYDKIKWYFLEYKGNAAYYNGEFGDAEIYYREILEQAPARCTILYNLGNALYQQERYPEAIGNYHLALRAADDSLRALVWNNLGNAFYKQHDFLRSADAYKNALLIHENSRSRRNFLFVMSKLNSKNTEIIISSGRRNIQQPNTKDQKTGDEGADKNGKKSAVRQELSEKRIEDIFNVINQREDNTRDKISQLKRAPAKIENTGPDY